MHTGRLSSLLAILVLTGLVLGAAPIAAQNGPSIHERHFLRIHERVSYPNGVGEVLALGYRDGLMVLFNTTPDGQLTVFRDRDPQMVESLQALLADAQIATQQGRCDIAEGIGPAIDLPLGATGRSTVFSWFGLRDGRSQHLLIGDPLVAGSFGTPCDAQLTLALGAVQSHFVHTFQPGNVSPPITFRADDEMLYVVQNSLQEDPTCGDGSRVDDSFVFRDGLVIRDATNSEGRFLFERGRAPLPTLRSFHNALADNRVGRAAGECEVSFFQPFSVDGACTDYSFQTGGTWHGQGPRRATLFATDATDQPCTFEQDLIAAAATEFLRNLSAQSRTQQVRGQLPTP